MKDIRKELKNMTKITAMLIAVAVMTLGTAGNTYAGLARDDEEVKRIELKEKIIHPILIVDDKVILVDDELVEVEDEELDLILDLDDVLEIEELEIEED